MRAMEINKSGKRVGVCGQKVATLNSVFMEGLGEYGTFEKRLERSESINHISVWREVEQAEEMQIC